MRLPLFRSILLAITIPVVASAQTPQWGIATTYPIPGPSSIFDVADFNLDGRPDLLVLAAYGPSSWVLLGQPNGSFLVQAVPADTGLVGNTIAVGLLDGDEFPDVLTGSRLMRGVGNGTFEQAAVQPVGLSSSLAVGIADFNADGRTDIVSGHLGQLRVALAAPSGGFYLPFAFPCCDFPASLVVTDVDGDGDPDVVAACNGGTGMTILTNGFPGGFTPQQYGRDDATRVAVGRFTGDGLPDIVAARRLLTNYGSGLFSPGPLLSNVAYGWYEPFDCDGDGLLDFVGPCDLCGGGIVVARGSGTGAFDTSCTVQLSNGYTPYCIRVVDALGDPRREVLALTPTSGTGYALHVIRNLAPDCNSNGIDDPVETASGGSTDCNSNGIPDFCEGDCDANGVLDPCQIAANPAEDLDADGTLDMCEVAGVAFCFGDGTGNACPCDPGQAGPIGSGCRHSGGAGARLEARGNPSVSVDSVTLRGSGILPTAIGLLFQGNQQQAGGLGGTFGDGLLCVNANVVRLGLRHASGGALSYGYGVPGDPSVAVQGQVPASGATRYYQHWYRDPAPFCTAGTFNLTNAVRIDWLP